MNKTNKIALLVDGDNAQAKMLHLILEEASKYGKVTIRRVYGDWTKPQMNTWKSILNEMAFNPIQKFSYTSGKNSTDSALIIDAMDILHDELVEGFCLVSSDSDYTGLAQRIREEGVFVMGIGEKKTPMAFVKSCEIFTYSENLEVVETKAEEPASSKAVKKIKSKVPPNMNLIHKAFNMSANESNEVNIATLGINLRKLDPSFDCRTYGFKTLTGLFASLDSFELVENIVNGRNHPVLRKK
ncbi:MAG: NYN domain-containing protein [Williamsia sp.]|nr:NYN domain-containing protein [Williamsia sp.]